jgi:hypothetical protein
MFGDGDKLLTGDEVTDSRLISSRALFFFSLFGEALSSG